jgi:hypothetical protein
MHVSYACVLDRRERAAFVGAISQARPLALALDSRKRPNDCALPFRRRALSNLSICGLLERNEDGASGARWLRDGTYMCVFDFLVPASLAYEPGCGQPEPSSTHTTLLFDSFSPLS